MNRQRGIISIVVVVLALAAGPAWACPWQLFAMYQDASLPDGYWWKPIQMVKGPEQCRAMVKAATHRPIVGLISWYHFPMPAPGPSAQGQSGPPAWLQAVLASKPAGGAEPWIGCLPSGYDPHERR